MIITEGSKPSSQEARDAFDAWVLKTYGWWSWEYATLGGLTKWTSSDLYKEWEKAGFSGLEIEPDITPTIAPTTLSDDEYFDQIMSDKSMSDSQKYSIIKDSFPQYLEDWLLAPLTQSVNTGEIDDNGDYIFEDIYYGGGQQFYLSNATDLGNGIFDFDGIRFTINSATGALMRAPDEPEDVKGQVAPNLWQDELNRYWRKDADGNWVEVPWAEGDKERREYEDSVINDTPIGEEVAPNLILYPDGTYHRPDGTLVPDNIAKLEEDAYLRTLAPPEENNLFPDDYIYNLAGYWEGDGKFWLVQNGQVAPISPEQAAELDTIYQAELAEITGGDEGDVSKLPEGMPPDSQSVIPGELWKDPATGQYYTVTNSVAYPIDAGMAQQMIDAYGQNLSGETPMTEYQNQSLELQRQELALYAENLARQAQQEQDQMKLEYSKYLAGLAANPAAFMEYAVATGQSAAVQPWMNQLDPTGQLQAGQQLPGWEGPGQPNPNQQPIEGGWTDWGGAGGGGAGGGGYTGPPIPGATTTPMGANEGWEPIPGTGGHGGGGGSNQTGGLPYNQGTEATMTKRYREILDELIKARGGTGYMDEWWNALSMQSKNALTQEAERLAREWYNQTAGVPYPVYPGQEGDQTTEPSQFLPPIIPPPPPPPQTQEELEEEAAAQGITVDEL